MIKLFWKKGRVGLPPGTITPSEAEENQRVRIRFINYDKSHFEERDASGIEESFPLKDSPLVSWINIDGRNADVIRKIDDYYGIHPLVIEDIMDTGQRAKVEDYEDYLFIVAKMIRFNKETDDIISEQIGLVLGKGYVLSFQEVEGDVFDAVRDRIRHDKGRVRQMGADYLAYSLLDAIVDNYFVVLENIGERIDGLEDDVIADGNPNVPAEIHGLKTSMIFLRKQIMPLREVVGYLQRNEPRQIKKTTQVYLRDLYDHTIQVNDAIDAFKEALSGLHDIYLSTISNRMNEIMKVLTIFAALFIPLTFIAGVYGMNFENMPELKWKHGYFIVLSFMALAAGGMIAFFRKRKWF